MTLPRSRPPGPGASETGPSAGEAGLEDRELVGRVADGDGAALEALYARYGRACYGLARRILADDQFAQDCVQEVFLAVWRDASRFDAARGGFSTWLLSMTHHKAVDAVRREENLRKRRTGADAARHPGERRTGRRRRRLVGAARGAGARRPADAAGRRSARPSPWPTSAATPSARSPGSPARPSAPSRPACSPACGACARARRAVRGRHRHGRRRRPRQPGSGGPTMNALRTIATRSSSPASRCRALEPEDEQHVPGTCRPARCASRPRRAPRDARPPGTLVEEPAPSRSPTCLGRDRPGIGLDGPAVRPSGPPAAPAGARPPRPSPSSPRPGSPPRSRRATARLAAAAAVVLSPSLGAWSCRCRATGTQPCGLASGSREAVAHSSGPAVTVPLSPSGARSPRSRWSTPSRLDLLVDGLAAERPGSSAYVLWGQSGAEPATGRWPASTCPAPASTSSSSCRPARRSGGRRSCSWSPRSRVAHRPR